MRLRMTRCRLLPSRSKTVPSRVTSIKGRLSFRRTFMWSPQAPARTPDARDMNVHCWQLIYRQKGKVTITVRTRVALFLQNRQRSNQTWISATTRWSSGPQQIAEKSINRSRWTPPHGRMLVSLIGGSRSVSSGSVGFGVLMASNGGSELLIFVPGTARSHDLTGLVGAGCFALQLKGLIGGFGGPRSDPCRIVVSFAVLLRS
jgi:hypothetical protein